MQIRIAKSQREDKTAYVAVGAFPLPCTRLDKQGETP